MPPTTGVGRFGALEAQARHVQPVHKRVDYPADVIVRDQFFQTNRKQCSLRPAFSLHKAHKKMSSLSRGHLLIYLPPGNGVS